MFLLTNFFQAVWPPVKQNQPEKVLLNLAVFVTGDYPGSRGSLRGERNERRERRASGHIDCKGKPRSAYRANENHSSELLRAYPLQIPLPHLIRFRI
jgi:hypothetical protein